MDQPTNQQRTSNYRLRWTRWSLTYVLIGLFLSGCQATYLMKSAYSQADLLRRRVPLDEALKDPSLSEENKRKLQLAKQARFFAEQELGLKATQNYTTFVQLNRPYVTYVVSAAPKNELKHHLWKYPVVGSMPYKGYFDPEDAKREAEELKKQGLDTFVRGVAAYSTLGWFRDPLLSSMLSYRDFDLVNTVIHETVHATIFIKSEADFNESLASFIGNKGTEEFYRKSEGEASPTLQTMRADAQDEQLFSEFISSELNALEKWYEERKGQALTEEERKARFGEIQKAFATRVRPRLKLTESYKNFETIELNNARLLTYRLYLEDLSDFDRMFGKFNGDFKRMVEYCKTLEGVENPKAALAQAAKAP